MRYHSPSTRRGSKIRVPEHASPLVKFIFSEMARQRVSYEEVEWRSGCLKSTLKAWRQRNSPSAANLDAVLGSLGWQLSVAPAADRILPDGLRADLQQIAAKHGLTSLPAAEYLAEQANGFSYPGCPLAERRHQFQQQHER